MNRWNIPDWVESEIKVRDKRCVYCGVEFGASPESRKTNATWEHIINDAKIINRGNIVRCCVSCNSSKGARQLADWLKSNYCRTRNISKETVAEVVRQALEDHEILHEDRV